MLPEPFLSPWQLVAIAIVSWLIGLLCVRRADQVEGPDVPWSAYFAAFFLFFAAAATWDLTNDYRHRPLLTLIIAVATGLASWAVLARTKPLVRGLVGVLPGAVTASILFIPVFL